MPNAIAMVKAHAAIEHLREVCNCDFATTIEHFKGQAFCPDDKRALDRLYYVANKSASAQVAVNYFLEQKKDPEKVYLMLQAYYAYCPKQKKGNRSAGPTADGSTFPFTQFQTATQVSVIVRRVSQGCMMWEDDWVSHVMSTRFTCDTCDTRAGRLPFGTKCCFLSLHGNTIRHRFAIILCFVSQITPMQQTPLQTDFKCSNRAPGQAFPQRVLGW